jgi:hypothetical protein
MDWILRIVIGEFVVCAACFLGGWHLAARMNKYCPYHWTAEDHYKKKCECYQDTFKRLRGLPPR